jgi:TolB protein
MVGYPRARTALAAGLMLALVMLVFVASVNPAGATFPGRNGKIAFVKESLRQGGSGIFTMNPDGSEQSRIGSGYSPSWSADGQRVVFTRPTGESEEDFNQDIYVMDADGDNVQQVTNSRAYEYSPVFSPDGLRVAYVRDHRTQGTDIFIRALDGSTPPVQLTDTPVLYEESLAYSVDDRISFSRSGWSESMDIFVMDDNPATDGATNLTKTGRTDEFEPNWSPDASRIVFASYRFRFSDGAEEPEEDAEISVMNSDGTQRRVLTESAAHEGSPAFSPNGARVAFSRYSFSRAEDESSDIFVMRADGSRVRQLTDTRAFEWGTDWQPLLSEATAQ